MGAKTILCQIKRADEPYYIDMVDLYVYSIEELCFFVDTYLPLIDESFFDEALSSWLENELHMQRLVQTIARLREETPDQVTEGAILALNGELDWLYAGDQEKFRMKIGQIQQLPTEEKLRKKADTLVSCKKYSKALEVYKKILRDNEKDEDKKTFIGTVYHNMGVTYARLFELEQAAECLKEAYIRLHTSDALKDYLYCVRLSEGTDAFHKRAAELGVDADTQKAMEDAVAQLPPVKRPENMDEAMNRWVRAYHRETGA